MTTVTNYATSASGTSWTTASNANANDGAYATYTIAVKNTTGNVNTLSNFGFDSSIPTGSTITSVALEVEHKVSTTSGIAFLESAVAISGTPGTFNSESGEPTTDTAVTYSSMARPGGGSWTRADLLNGTFTVQLRARSGNSATSVTYSWDYARVTVVYVPKEGSGTPSLPVVTASGSGTKGRPGSGSPSLPIVTAAGTGEFSSPRPNDGTFTSRRLTGVLGPRPGNFARAATAPGDGAPALPLLTASGSGIKVSVGSGSPSLPVITASGTGIKASVGSGSPSLPIVTATGTGQRALKGDGAPALPIVTATGDGSSATSGVHDGTGAVTLPVLTSSGAASRAIKGSGAVALPVITATGAGSGGAGTPSGGLPPTFRAMRGFLESTFQ